MIKSLRLVPEPVERAVDVSRTPCVSLLVGGARQQRRNSRDVPAVPARSGTQIEPEGPQAILSPLVVDGHAVRSGGKQDRRRECVACSKTRKRREFTSTSTR